MTQEQQRIAIGTACKTLGWWYCPQCRESLPVTSAIACPKCRTEMHRDGPNYPADLNAMHEAEKTLRNNQFHFVNYLRQLWCVIYPAVKYTGDLGYLGFDCIHATAAQRAEAFLRTLNLWKESP